MEVRDTEAGVAAEKGGGLMIGFARRFANMPLYSNAIYLIATVVINSAMGFLFWVVAARFYSESEVGFGCAILAVVSLVSAFCMLGLNFSLIRFLPSAGKPVEMINTYSVAVMLLTLLGGIIFLGGMKLWAPSLNPTIGNPLFAVAFLLFALLQSLDPMIEAAFVALRKAQYVVLKNIIFSLLKLLPLVPLALFLHDLPSAAKGYASIGIIASIQFGTFICLAVAYFYFLPRIQKGYKPRLVLKPACLLNRKGYSMGNYFTSLFAIAPTLVLPLIIVNVLTADDNAFFYIAWMIAVILFAIPNSIAHSLFAEGSTFEGRLRGNTIKAFKFSFLLLVPAIIATILVAKWVLLLFGANYSENGTVLLQVLALSAFPLTVVAIYSTVLRVTGRIRELVAIWLAIAAATLVGAYFILPITGIVGVGYVWLGAQLLAGFFILTFRRGVLNGKEFEPNLLGEVLPSKGV